MRRPRRCCPRRARRWRERSTPGPTPVRPMPTAARSRALLEEARSTIAEALGWRHDVIFTSGASEAIEIAAARARLPRRAHSARPSIDASIMRWAKVRRIIPVDARWPGRRSRACDAVLEAGPALVAIQLVNNETGVIQPLDRLAPMVRAAGSLLLADCAQSAGKLALARCRFHCGLRTQVWRAARGRRPAGPRPCDARSQSVGRRRAIGAGPQDAPGCAGLCRGARSTALRSMTGSTRLRERLETDVEAAGGVVIAEDSPRIPTIGAVSRCPALASAILLVQFDLAGISVSAGSACSSGSMKASAVLAAMGVPAEIAGQLSSGQLRARDQRSRHRPLPRASGGGSPSGRRRRLHDLSRLSGDHARRARSGQGDAVRGSRRSSPTRTRRRAGGTRPRRRSRSRASRSRRRSASRAEASLSPEARPRRSTGRSRERSKRRRRAATGSSPSRPSMPRCSTPASGWRGGASI